MNQLSDNLIDDKTCPAFFEGVPILIISLKDSKQRRVSLKKNGIPSDWVDNYMTAFDLRAASEATIKDLADVRSMSFNYKRHIKPSEVGCSMSHKQALKWLAESSYDAAVVFEDDVVPKTKQFLQELSRTLTVMKILASRGVDFVCHIGARPDQTYYCTKRKVYSSDANLPTKDTRIYMHYDPFHSLWRAHAYIVSKASAINALKKEDKIMTLSDDWLYRKNLGLLGYLFYTEHEIFGQDEEVESTIGHPPNNDDELKDQSKNTPIAIRMIASLRYRLKARFFRITACIPYKF